MASERKQTYKNHIRHDTFAYFYLFLLFVSVVLAAIGTVVWEFLIPIALIVNTIATMFVAINARRYATKLQDRIIRTEMRARLKDLYRGDPLKRVDDFTLSQLIALRFTNDEELAELSQFVLDEHVTDTKQIKQMIHDWEPDFLRV